MKSFESLASRAHRATLLVTASSCTMAVGVTLSAAIATASLVACGAEAELDDELARERNAEASDEDETGALSDADRARLDEPDSATDTAEGTVANAGLSKELAEALEREATAPGYVAQPYPEPPFGYVAGSVIANYEFLGWSAPSSTSYDLNQVEMLNLAAFYDSDGSKGIELLMINAVAVWCGVCQAEYIEIRESGVYQRLRARGLEMLGVLFEDADGAPARYADLQNWTRAFEVDFPFVLDPAFQLGGFFDRSATPMNMVVDAGTMEVLVAMTGYDPELFAMIERELTTRGR